VVAPLVGGEQWIPSGFNVIHVMHVQMYMMLIVAMLEKTGTNVLTLHNMCGTTNKQFRREWITPLNEVKKVKDSS
jgi:hypothetical protein